MIIIVIFNRGNEKKTMLRLYEFQYTWCLVVTGAGTNFSSVDAKFQLRNKKQIHGFNIVLYQSKIGFSIGIYRAN